MPEDTFIVATEEGILHKMRALAPHKKFITAPTAGEGATCESLCTLSMDENERFASFENEF